jgi:Mrp family chromosome partitioning ATPase
LHEQSSIKHVIAVVSGKGGVGKSLATSLIVSALHKAGLRVGILDADITGPSIPRSFGVEEGIRPTAQGLLPATSSSGIPFVSTNLLLPEETTPVLWRGAILSGMVQRFWAEVIWGELDYLVIDMPPGTGDIPLTVYQSLPIDGVVVVTAPQDLVSMIVGKAINMAEAMEVPVLALVENMSYFECPSCGTTHHIFGAGRIEELAQGYGIGLVAKIPLSPHYAQRVDAGEVEKIEVPGFDDFIRALIAKTGE